MSFSFLLSKYCFLSKYMVQFCKVVIESSEKGVNFTLSRRFWLYYFVIPFLRVFFFHFKIKSLNQLINFRSSIFIDFWYQIHRSNKLLLPWKVKVPAWKLKHQAVQMTVMRNRWPKFLKRIQNHVALIQATLQLLCYVQCLSHLQ